MSTNDSNTGLWARLCLCFPLKILERRVKVRKNKSMTLKGTVLDLLFCLSTLLCCSLICYPCCFETKRSRQFHHHHTGACPANVKRDLLQEDREVHISLSCKDGFFKKILFYFMLVRRSKGQDLNQKNMQKEKQL